MAETSSFFMHDPDKYGDTDHAPYPEEADRDHMANPQYDPKKLTVGGAVIRLFQASGIPLSKLPSQVIEITDTTVTCRYDGRDLVYDKTTGIAMKGIDYGRLETE